MEMKSFAKKLWVLSAACVTSFSALASEFVIDGHLASFDKNLIETITGESASSGTNAEGNAFWFVNGAGSAVEFTLDLNVPATHSPNPLGGTNYIGPVSYVSSQIENSDEQYRGGAFANSGVFVVNNDGFEVPDSIRGNFPLDEKFDALDTFAIAASNDSGASSFTFGNYQSLGFAAVWIAELLEDGQGDSLPPSFLFDNAPQIIVWRFTDLNGPEGNEILLTANNAPAVPVPSAVWLLGSALLGLTGVARRRQVH